MKSRKAILFMAQLPPPVHGAALRNKSLLESEEINKKYILHSLPLKFVDDIRDLGKFSFKKILLTIQYCFRLSGILMGRKVDFVYFTMSPSGGAFYRDIIFISIIKLFRKKRLLHFRVKGIQQTATSKLGRKLVRFAFKGSDVICLSYNHTKDVEGLTWNKPYIVANGIKVEREFLELFGNTLPNREPPRILFLSNLSRKKGVPELLEALGNLKLKNHSFTADLVGSEWDMSFEDVRKLIREHGLNGNVNIAGPKYGKEKFQFIAQADIFVFPTYFELFPGVVLEAMQFGKAIVSTTEGSIPEIIDHGVNGLLVEPRNTSQLAAAIESMLENPEQRQNMGQLAQSKFFKEFTLTAFENRMIAVFDDVLDKER
jgi:glycosyltransferase involved in cell wall biosynthesis